MFTSSSRARSRLMQRPRTDAAPLSSKAIEDAAFCPSGGSATPVAALKILAPTRRSSGKGAPRAAGAGVGVLRPPAASLRTPTPAPAARSAKSEAAYQLTAPLLP